jgi:hypothetical protein
VREPDDATVLLQIALGYDRIARYTVTFNVEPAGRVIDYRRHAGGPTPSVVRAAAYAWHTRHKEADWNDRTDRAMTFLALDGTPAPHHPAGRPRMTRADAERIVGEYKRASAKTTSTT